VKPLNLKNTGVGHIIGGSGERNRFPDREEAICCKMKKTPSQLQRSQGRKVCLPTSIMISMKGKEERGRRGALYTGRGKKKKKASFPTGERGREADVRLQKNFLKERCRLVHKKNSFIPWGTERKKRGPARLTISHAGGKKRRGKAAGDVWWRRKGRGGKEFRPS